MRRLAGLTVVLLSLTLLAASPKKKALPTPAAPDIVPHSIALFLSSLSRDGARQVTFRATAVGTRFFIEEPAGVTVYRFEKGRYLKEELVRGSTLAKVTKRYAASGR
jgi:hypothetical protein